MLELTRQRREVTWGGLWGDAEAPRGFPILGSSPWDRRSQSCSWEVWIKPGSSPRVVDAPTPPRWVGERPTHVGDAGTERQPRLLLVLPVPVLQG